MDRLVLGMEWLFAWGYAMLAVNAVLIMTYVETLGVTFFSYRRGWRVPFATAERVACYASVGWVPATVVMAGIHLALETRTLQRWWLIHFSQWTADYTLGLWAVGFGLAILGFESLVWLGVRRVRYGNSFAGS